MNSELARRVGMEHRLRSALDDEQFVLHYQPKVTLRTGKISSVEALLRWHDPENGLIAPGIFLPLLESAGLMPAIGAWVLRQAAADCREWRRLGLPPVRIAVNISPPELRRRNTAREILECLGDLAGDSHWGVDIEVTEGALAGRFLGMHPFAEVAASGGHARCDRRFRNRVFLTGPPLGTADRYTQDRSLVHDASARATARAVRWSRRSSVWRMRST